MATDIWLLSALMVLVVIAITVILNACAEWLNRDGTEAESLSKSDPVSFGKPKHIERFVYRHHRIFGALVLIGAAVYLVSMAANGLLWPVDTSSALGMLLAVLTILSLALLPFSAIMLLRPSLLKNLEIASNRWIEWQNPTTSRIVRILIGLYCLSALIVLIFERIQELVRY